jgi:5-methylcytosine-specific restriction endonuclease McrA
VKRTPLRRRSAKTRIAYVARARLVAGMLAERPWCEIRWDDGCQGRAVDVDEVLGRGVGGSILDEANCQTTCRHCHDRKHNQPTEAVRRGLTRRAG